MKVINPKDPIRLARVFSYGAIGTGKTAFAASWPRPMFLSDNLEQGHETVLNMDPDLFFEPGRYPEIHLIESMKDMLEDLAKLEERIKNRPGDIQTLVVDSATYYSQMIVDQLLRNPPRTKNGEINTLELYGNLAQHLRAVLTRAHALPIHVIWTAHDKVDQGRYGADIIGKAAGFIPGACNYLLVHVKNAEGGFEVHTRGFEKFPGRGRDWGKLPDVIEPNYQVFAEHLGWLTPKKQVEQARQSMRPVTQRR